MSSTPTTPTTPSPIPPAASTTAPPPPTPGRKPAPSSPRASRAHRGAAESAEESASRGLTCARSEEARKSPRPPRLRGDLFASCGLGAAGELAEGAVVADRGLAGALDVLVVQPGADGGCNDRQHAAQRGQAALGEHHLGDAGEQFRTGAARQVHGVRSVRVAEHLEHLGARPVGLEVRLEHQRDLHDQRELQRGDEGEVGGHRDQAEEPAQRAAGPCPGLLRVDEALRDFLRLGARIARAQIVHAPPRPPDLVQVELSQLFLGDLRQHGRSLSRALPRAKHQAGEQTCRRMSSSSSAFPAPITTELSGSSARKTGSPVSSRRSASRFLSSAPPPASTMPRSAMSPASSGGVRSSVIFTASTIPFTGSASASRISSDVTVSVRGTPATRSRPLISIVITSSVGYAVPMPILIISAVRSPMSRLYLRFTY